MNRIVTTVLGMMLALAGIAIAVLSTLDGAVSLHVVVLSLSMVLVGGFFTSRSLMTELLGIVTQYLPWRR